MVVNCYVQLQIYISRILPPGLSPPGPGYPSPSVALALTVLTLTRISIGTCSSYMYVRATQHVANQLLLCDVTYVNQAYTGNQGKTGSKIKTPVSRKIVLWKRATRYEKGLITRSVYLIFSWNLYHWTQYSQGYRSKPKMRYWRNIPRAPFSHSGSHITN